LPQPNADWDASEPNAYSYSYGNSYVYSDSDGDGNSYAYANGDCYGNSHIYANGDSDSNVHSNSNCHSDGYRHRYSNCDGIAAAYTDAKASADTTASSLALFRIMGTRENELVSSQLVVIGRPQRTT
jgi:hypothetical protein